MKTLGYITCFFALLLLIGSVGGCSKEQVSTFAEGTYTGKYVFSSRLGIVYTHTETPAYISFDNGNYTADQIMPNANSVPGKGTYALKADTAIDFKSASSIQIYTAAYYVNGLYKREYKGDSLILTLNIPETFTTYQYRLKRN